MKRSACLHQIFASKALENPQRVAVVGETGTLTYGQLDERANAVAQSLLCAGVGPNVLVGLYVDRSVENVIGILAILKAGGAYVPIDPTYPPTRVNFMINDSGVPLILTVHRLASGLQGCGTKEVLFIDDIASSPCAARVLSRIPVKPSHLAYVIYTSGSTGTPKGVLIEHRNVTRLFYQTRQWLRFDERDVWTLFHSTSFDFSVWEIWGALLHGGTLVIVPAEVTRSPQRFRALLRSHRVTVLNQTPSAFRQLLEADLRHEGRSNFDLRYVILGGEALETDLAEKWIDRYGDSQPMLVNMYGITETTVHVTFKRVTRGDVGRSGFVPIGVPIPDLQIHLLDERGHEVRDGSPGEIYVGGAGLARGYLNRSALMSDRFIRIQSRAEKGAVRFYRSGDRGARLITGELIYLGRVDDQIKVRGFRIEPQEIELCLAQHPQVGRAVVVAQDYGQGDVRLVAYIVPKVGLDPSPQMLKQLTRELSVKAAAHLPPFMSPSVFRIVPSVPITANGKVDRAALPRMTVLESTTTDFLGRMTSTEQTIAEIAGKVLHATRIRIEEDLFELGGTSLSVVRILGHIAEHFGISLDGSDFVSGLTVKQLAATVDKTLRGTVADP